MGYAYTSAVLQIPATAGCTLIVTEAAGAKLLSLLGRHLKEFVGFRSVANAVNRKTLCVFADIAAMGGKFA
jgi:hypothetical protein